MPGLVVAAEAAPKVGGAGVGEAGAGEAGIVRRAPIGAIAGDQIVSLAKLVAETAFQPIVEIETGAVHGYEALLRGHERLGLASPNDLLDAAHAVGEVGRLEQMLQARALARFTAVPANGAKVFLNLDGRVLDESLSIVDVLETSVRQSGLRPSAVVLELSERHDHLANPAFARFMLRLRAAGFRVALDDFGIGFSELRLLCDFGIDYIKIDGHFLRGIAKDQRKRLFVTTLADLAHVLGVRVVAEGVETEGDYLACREVGCDLVQGWFVARPTTEVAELASTYGHVQRARASRRRERRSDALLVRSELEPVPAIADDASLEEVFDAFRRNPRQSFFPVVDSGGSPSGIVHERDLKEYIYSPYGRDLLRNKGAGLDLRHFVRSCPITDVDAGAARLLDVFAHSRDADCVVVTENLRYLGVLSAAALLKIMSDKRIQTAQDQNPLTELPGNLSISDFVAEAALDGESDRVFCWFDFDHFKPFNDRYGFRQGDAAINLFASTMRRRLGGAFLGHIGGDDFFAGMTGCDAETAKPQIRALLDDFAAAVVDLYDPVDRAAGRIMGTDRHEQPRSFPLMRCSAAVLELPEGRVSAGLDRIVETIADLKSRAKRSADGLVVARFEG